MKCQKMILQNGLVFISILFIGLYHPLLAQEKMEIAGAIIVSNSEDPTPVAGTIRFNTSTNDFEGYTGSTWKSLTRLADSPSNEYVEDIDGNRYDIVKIGDQIWMAENLMVENYNDGNPINFSFGFGFISHQWVYDNDLSNLDIHGRLYSWTAVNSSKLCPTGWRIPSKNDWLELKFHVGDRSDGGLFKEPGLEFWNAPNTGANNLTRFSARGSGRYDINSATFNGLKQAVTWWSSTVSGTTGRISTEGLRHQDNLFASYSLDLTLDNDALPVRCIKN